MSQKKSLQGVSHPCFTNVNKTPIGASRLSIVHQFSTLKFWYVAIIHMYVNDLSENGTLCIFEFSCKLKIKSTKVI